jgi:hypothetical protein
MVHGVNAASEILARGTGGRVNSWSVLPPPLPLNPSLPLPPNIRAILEAIQVDPASLHPPRAALLEPACFARPVGSGPHLGAAGAFPLGGSGLPAVSELPPAPTYDSNWLVPPPLNLTHFAAKPSEYPHKKNALNCSGTRPPRDWGAARRPRRCDPCGGGRFDLRQPHRRALLRAVRARRASRLPDPRCFARWPPERRGRHSRLARSSLRQCPTPTSFTFRSGSVYPKLCALSFVPLPWAS